MNSYMSNYLYTLKISSCSYKYRSLYLSIINEYLFKCSTGRFR